MTVLGHMRINIVFSDVFSDVIKLAVGLIVSTLLLRLHFRYGRPRAMVIVLLGMMLYSAGALLNLLNDIYYLPWILRYVVLNLFDAAGVFVFIIGATMLLQRLFGLINMDPLTCCYNRRFLQDVLSIEIERAKRTAGALTVLFVDINNFKAINDKLGHAAGDAVLRTVAQKLKQSVRVSDIVARWGGDEFVVVFPQTGGGTALTLVNRLVDAVNGSGNCRSEFTVSVGTAAFPGDGDDPDRLLSLADKRMYQNKSGGGPQVSGRGSGPKP